MNVTDIISVCGTGATIAGVFAALFISNRQIRESRRQLDKQIEQSRQLATEEHQHQTRPTLVPDGEIPDVSDSLGQKLYTPELPPRKGNIQWEVPVDVTIKVKNHGMGPAFNLQCVLYGDGMSYISQFVSWNNTKVGHEEETLSFRHPAGEFCLDWNDTVDGKQHLYRSPVWTPNPNGVQARLTMTYRDTLDNNLLSIFDYTIEHQWICVCAGAYLPKTALDLKELNEQKKEKTAKGIPTS